MFIAYCAMHYWELNVGSVKSWHLLFLPFFKNKVEAARILRTGVRWIVIKTRLGMCFLGRSMPSAIDADGAWRRFSWSTEMRRMTLLSFVCHGVWWVLCSGCSSIHHLVFRSGQNVQTSVKKRRNQASHVPGGKSHWRTSSFIGE